MFSFSLSSEKLSFPIPECTIPVLSALYSIEAGFQFDPSDMKQHRLWTSKLFNYIDNYNYNTLLLLLF